MATPFLSKLFRRSNLRDGAILRLRAGIKTMMECDEAVVRELMEGLLVLGDIRSSTEQVRFVDEQLHRLDIDAAAADQLVKDVFWFLLELPYGPAAGDTSDVLASDMLSAGWVDATQRRRLGEHLEHLLHVVGSKHHVQRRIQAVEAGVMPAYRAVGVTVEIRGVPSGELSQIVGKDLPPFVGFVPVATLCLSLDSGEPNSISFQCSAHQLDGLIDTLQEARADLTSLASVVVGSILEGQKR